MARGKYGSQNGTDKPAAKPRGVGAGDNAVFRGYINLNLSDAQKEAFPAWADSASYWEALEGLVAQGVNIALRWDAKGECYLASGTQRREGSPNAGLCVTARASAPAKALARLLFCLTILSARERWEETQPLADPDRW